MKTSLDTNELSREKLFGIKEAMQQTVTSTTKTEVASAQSTNKIRENAVLEAEHKKAEALTISRRYAFLR